MKNDLLFQIFQHQLHDPECKIQCNKEFITKVVNTYMVFLNYSGNIPGNLRDSVVEDLEAEVLEMFRKTTYGFFNLIEYRDGRAKKG